MAWAGDFRKGMWPMSFKFTQLSMKNSSTVSPVSWIIIADYKCVTDDSVAARLPSHLNSTDNHSFSLLLYLYVIHTLLY